MATGHQQSPSQFDSTRRAKRAIDLDAVEGPGSNRRQTEITENGAPTRRSVRSTKGQGGALKQMQVTSDAVHAAKKSKSRVQAVPNNVAANPMAPAPKKPSRQYGKANRTVLVPPQGLPAPAMPLPGMHLAPPGSGPNISRSSFGLQPPQQPATISSCRDDRVSVGQPSRPRHQALSSTVPSRHLLPSDSGQVGSQVTRCEDESDGADSSGVGYEDDDNSSTREELEQVSPGTSKILLDDGPICYPHDEIPYGNNDGDNAFQTLNSKVRGVNDESRDPLLEPGFDQSPSEDERLAEEQLGGHSYDVLERHHNQNRAPRPPDPQQLRKIRSSNGNVAKVGNDDEHETEPPSGVDELSSGSRRLRQHSQKSHSGHSTDPNQLRFYPSQWRDVLDNAIKWWRLWMVLSCAFPNRGNHNHSDMAIECIVKALDEHQKNGASVESGYWPEFKYHMREYLYGDRSTFRQVIKKKAGEIVRLHYDFHPPEELEIECHNQEQLYEYISSAIIKIITKGEYLNGGKDEEGRTNNLTHVAVRELSIYISRLVRNNLPAESMELMSSRIVALASAAIRCCLDAWLCGRLMNNPFTAEKYELTYNVTLKLIEEMKGNSYHWNKFITARRSWAAAAKVQGCPTDGTEATEMKIHLD